MHLMSFPMLLDSTCHLRAFFMIVALEWVPSLVDLEHNSTSLRAKKSSLNLSFLKFCLTTSCHPPESEILIVFKQIGLQLRSVLMLFKCLTDKTIVLIQATDGDIGINAAFLYSILSGDTDNNFTVDPASGVLSTTGPLDREEHDSYILLVRVSDLHGNHSYGVVFDDSTVVEVVVEVSGLFLKAFWFQCERCNCWNGQKNLRWSSRSYGTTLHWSLRQRINTPASPETGGFSFVAASDKHKGPWRITGNPRAVWIHSMDSKEPKLEEFVVGLRWNGWPFFLYSGLAVGF